MAGGPGLLAEQPPKHRRAGGIRVADAAGGGNTTGRGAGAEQSLRRCLELDPDNYLGNYHLLMLYQRTKDGREEAQARRFEELKQRREEKADEFRRVIDVRPY